jgi:hypothetical protein
VEVILRDNDMILVPHVAVPLRQVREDGQARPEHAGDGGQAR